MIGGRTESPFFEELSAIDEDNATTVSRQDATAMPFLALVSSFTFGPNL